MLTNDTHFNTSDTRLVHTVNSETLIGFIENTTYNINSSDEADVLELKQFNNSSLNTNNGNDTLVIHGSLDHSTITTGNESDHITLADLVDNSVIALGSTNDAADTAGIGDHNQ